MRNVRCGGERVMMSICQASRPYIHLSSAGTIKISEKLVHPNSCDLDTFRGSLSFSGVGYRERREREKWRRSTHGRVVSSLDLHQNGFILKKDKGDVISLPLRLLSKRDQRTHR